MTGLGFQPGVLTEGLGLWWVERGCWWHQGVIVVVGLEPEFSIGTVVGVGMPGAVVGVATVVGRGSTGGVVVAVGGWVLVASGVVVVVAVGEGVGGSSLVEQAVVIRIAVMIVRAVSVADRVASLSRSCREAKLFRLPAIATSSNSSQ